MVPSFVHVDNVLAITHVLTSLHVGGAERMALLLAGAQASLGHQVSVVSFEEPPDGALGPEFEQAGLPVRRIPKRPDGFDYTLSARLLSHFRGSAPDVVHTHNALPLIYAAISARLCGARVLHTMHGNVPPRGLQKWLRRLGAAAVHCFVAVSAATADVARKLGEVSTSKIRVILNATDVERFKRDESARTDVRRSWGVGAGGYAIGTVGRVAEVKNHTLLLRAVAPLLGSEVVLVIAGDGPERARCEALAKELEIAEHVRFLGVVSYVPRVMSGFDVFVLSSRSEGLPLVLAEAMAASLPVVATDVGGVANVVVDGDTGFVVDAGDEQGLRERIDRLRMDADLSRAFGARGAQLAAERYALDRMADDYFKAYR
jgi:glycosyltransferase involved in cell wall biosynthesis